MKAEVVFLIINNIEILLLLCISIIIFFYVWNKNNVMKENKKNYTNQSKENTKGWRVVSNMDILGQRISAIIILIIALILGVIYYIRQF